METAKNAGTIFFIRLIYRAGLKKSKFGKDLVRKGEIVRRVDVFPDYQCGAFVK
jgi:hypothetical protein